MDTDGELERYQDKKRKYEEYHKSGAGSAAWLFGEPVLQPIEEGQPRRKAVIKVLCGKQLSANNHSDILKHGRICSACTQQPSEYNHRDHLGFNVMEFSKEAGLAVPLEVGKMLLTVVGSASIQWAVGVAAAAIAQSAWEGTYRMFNAAVTTLAATADIEDVNGMASMLTRLYRLCVTDTDLKLMADDYTAVVEGLAGGASVPVYQDASTLDMFNIVRKPEFQVACHLNRTCKVLKDVFRTDVKPAMVNIADGSDHNNKCSMSGWNMGLVSILIELGVNQLVPRLERHISREHHPYKSSSHYAAIMFVVQWWLGHWASQLKHGRLGSEGSEAQNPMQLDQGKGQQQCSKKCMLPYAHDVNVFDHADVCAALVKHGISRVQDALHPSTSWLAPCYAQMQLGGLPHVFESHPTGLVGANAAAGNALLAAAGCRSASGADDGGGASCQTYSSQGLSTPAATPITHSNSQATASRTSTVAATGRGGIRVQEVFNVLLLLLMDNILGSHVKQASAGLLVCGLGVLMPVMIVR
eukprot:gene12894-13020_t